MATSKMKIKKVCEMVWHNILCPKVNDTLLFASSNNLAYKEAGAAEENTRNRNQSPNGNQ